MNKVGRGGSLSAKVLSQFWEGKWVMVSFPFRPLFWADKSYLCLVPQFLHP